MHRIAHSLMLTHSLTNTYSLILTHSLTHSLTHAYSLTRSLLLTHSLTITVGKGSGSTSWILFRWRSNLQLRRWSQCLRQRLHPKMYWVRFQWMRGMSVSLWRIEYFLFPLTLRQQVLNTTHPIMYSLTHSLTHLLTHSLTYLFNQSWIRLYTLQFLTRKYLKWRARKGGARKQSKSWVASTTPVQWSPFLVLPTIGTGIMR